MIHHLQEDALQDVRDILREGLKGSRQGREQRKKCGERKKYEKEELLIYIEKGDFIPAWAFKQREIARL